MSASSFFTRLNPVFDAILRRPVLHWAFSWAVMVLEYTGRRTGRQISLIVGYRQHGDDLAVLVSEARTKTWWRNFREPGPVRLILKGRRRTGKAVLVSHEDDYFRHAVEEILRRVPGMKGVFKLDFDRERGLTPEQIAFLGHEIACVRITLTPEA